MGMRVLTVVGLSFLWSVLYSDIYFPLSFVFDGSGTFSQADLSYFHTLFCVVLLCLLVICFFARRLIQDLVRFHARALAVAGVVTGVTGAFVLALGSSVRGVEEVEIGAATTLLALWLVLVFLGWTNVLMRGSESEMAQNVCLSFVVHLVVVSLVLLTGVPLVAYQLACPLFASLALAFFPERSERSTFVGAQAFRELPYRIIVPLWFFIFLGIVSTRLMVGSTNGILTTDSRLMTIVPSLVIAGIMTVWCFAATWSSDTEFSMFSFLAVAAVFGFVVVILLNQYDLPFSTKRIAVASEHCQELLCFMVLVSTCIRKRLSPLVAVIAFLAACFLVPRFAANDLVYFAGAGITLDASGSMATVSAAVIFVFTVLIVVLLMRYGKQYREQGRGQESDRLAERCERLARTGGLSKRETETLVCLCEGMSVRDVAETMCIAESTVKTHVKHIYEKLDVHSRRDLSQLVDGYASDTSA